MGNRQIHFSLLVAKSEEMFHIKKIIQTECHSWGRGETAAGSLPGFSNAKITTKKQPETELCPLHLQAQTLKLPPRPSLTYLDILHKLN